MVGVSYIDLLGALSLVILTPVGLIYWASFGEKLVILLHIPGLSVIFLFLRYFGLVKIGDFKQDCDVMIISSLIISGFNLLLQLIFLSSKYKYYILMSSIGLVWLANYSFYQHLLHLASSGNMF